ncbi:MAG: tetratricopeptide repeat protein [Nitrospirota bacterium]
MSSSRRMVNSDLTRAAAMIGIFLAFSTAAFLMNIVLQDAVQLWRAVVIKMPETASPHSNLVARYAQPEQYEQANRALQLKNGIRPDHPQTHDDLRMGSRNLETKHRDVQKYPQVSRSAPDHPKTYYDHARMYGGLREYSDVQNELRTAVGTDDDTVLARFCLGVIYAKRGKYEQAMAEFDAVMRIMPDEPAVFYNKGIVHELQGRQNDAVSDYENAIKRNPYYFEAYINLGSLYAKWGRYADAAKVYQKVLDIDPSHAIARHNLRWIEEKRGRTSEGPRQAMTAR